jgi:hypothetical protein
VDTSINPQQLRPRGSHAKLAERLEEHAGFDTPQAYRPGSPEASSSCEARIKLARREAEILGVEEWCQGRAVDEPDGRAGDRLRPRFDEAPLLALGLLRLRGATRG